MNVSRSRTPVTPSLPLAPGDYSKEYMDLLVQAIDTALDDLRSPRVIRTGRIILENFPEDARELRVGEVFIDGSLLRVVRENDTFTGTNILSSALGTVTVNVT